MENFLDTSTSGIRQRLDEATRTKDIGQAKYAIGLLTGLLVGAAPEAQRYILLRTAEACAGSSDLQGILTDGYWLLSRANDFL